MNKVTGSEVKWHDKALLIRSILVGLICFGVLLVIGERAKPPEGYAFERLPLVSGVYQCCGSGGKSSWSRVGTTAAICKRMDYFPATGGGWFDCGHKEELNGRVVEIERTIVPILFSENGRPVVVKLSSGDKTYLEYSDQRIRELWVASMRSGALLLGFFAALIVHVIQLIYSYRFSKQLQK